MMFSVQMAGESVHLLPHRALYRPRSKTLYVADTHWGKTATFRAHGIPLPTGDLDADLARLSDALQRTGAERLVVLGDLIHARLGLAPDVIHTVRAWRDSQPKTAMALVPGNHDRPIALPGEWRIERLEEQVEDAGWTLTHDPDQGGGAFSLGGHLHPTWPLNGKGHQRLTLPCFLLRTRALVLPAFASFSGRVASAVDDVRAVYVVSPTQVVQVR